VVCVFGLSLALRNESGKADLSLVLLSVVVDYSCLMLRVVVQIDCVGFAIIMSVVNDEIASDGL
jgi:hypothetical protein